MEDCNKYIRFDRALKRQPRNKDDTVSRLYPEHYILKANEFSKVAKGTLEEWIYHLNAVKRPDGASAPGIDQAKKRLKPGRMTKDEQKAYYGHPDNIVTLRDNIFTERAEGRAEGEMKNNIDNAARIKALGLTAGIAGKVTGLSADEIGNVQRWRH